MAAHAARRLLPMAENVAHVVGIELLAAAQGCDFHAPLAIEPRRSERARAVPARARAASRGRPLPGARHRGRGRARALGHRSVEAAGSPGWMLPRRSKAGGDPHDPHRQRPRDPRAARHRDLRQELAHRSAAAHADEQPRSRGGREARASSSSMAASAAPRATGRASTASSPRCARSRPTRRCWCSPASRSASSAPTPTRRAC